MSPYLVLALTLGYFLLLFIISWLSGRKADNQGFFIGNRSNAWYLVAIAMIGSGISGVTYVSVPGMVGTSGFSYLQMVLGFLVGQLVIAFVLLPLFYRMRLVSIYQYLEHRFGTASYRTGAWYFFISKMLGASVRLFLVSLTLQVLAFDPLGIPFIFNIVLTMLLVWVYTFIGGVKSIIATDILKTCCLVISVVLSIYYISRSMDLSISELFKTVKESEMSRLFFFDDVNDRRYFFKLFIAGIFTVIATNGLDQDMMQRNLSCRNHQESRKNMITSMLFQFVIIALFLTLGVMLYNYAAFRGIALPSKSDTLFPLLATEGYFPLIVGILFIIGLMSAAFSAAGSALTALTTSFTLDILQGGQQDEARLAKLRQKVHLGMSIVMGLCLYLFNTFNNTSVIDATYILASYTYGPILGFFAFGILSKRKVKDRMIPFVALVAPLFCFILDRNSQGWFGGYKFSYEILLLNALFTMLGLALFSFKPNKL